jgi:hAT family C-terminal dimerisation region
MNPANVGMHVNQHNEGRIYNFFTQIATSPIELEGLHTQFNLFNKSISPFEQSALCWKYKNNPRQFWISALIRATALAKLGNRIFQCPANSIPSERAFSTQNFIHSKIRNRLNPEHVDKLTYIYMNSHVFRVRDGKNENTVVNCYSLDILTPEQEIELEDTLLQEEDEDI